MSPLRRLLIRFLVHAATNGPIAWAASWHARVWSAMLFEEQNRDPIRLRDVLPWAPPRPAAEIHDFVLTSSLPPIEGIAFSGERKIFGLAQNARTPST